MTSPDTSVDGADRTSLEGLIDVDRLTEWMDASPICQARVNRST